MKAEATSRNDSKAVFDPLMDRNDEFLRDPFPALNAMRDRSPVLWSERGRHWIVSGYEEALHIMRTQDCCKRIERWKHPNILMRSVIRFRSRTMRSMLIEDPPQHTRLRSLVNSAFTPAVVQRLDPNIQNIANRLVDSFIERREAELISQYCFVLPVTVIAELLGVAPEDREKFKNWSGAITAGLQGKFDLGLVYRSLSANYSLSQYLKAIIEKKKREPQQDLISALIKVHSAGDGRLSENELLANCVLLLLAGHETTVNLIGNGLYNLLKHPDQMYLLKEKPELINSAVEEFLRYDPPVQFVRRMVSKSFEIGGKHLKENDAVSVLITPANRDPRIHSNPDQMDITRQQNKHLSFGAGIHFCLGAELARAEARIAIMTILNRLNELKLAESKPPAYKRPFLLRGLKRLDVVFGS